MFVRWLDIINLDIVAIYNTQERTWLTSSHPARPITNIYLTKAKDVILTTVFSPQQIMRCAEEYNLGLDIRTAAYIVAMERKSTTLTLWLASHSHNPFK